MPHPTWIGRTLSNRYRIDSLLGQGGMSAVYKATDPHLKRAVAIKLIHEHLSTDPSFVHRFENEAAAVANLNHPNIVKVFDFNNDDGVYYMVLEFVKGETLQDRLKRLAENKQHLPLEDALHIGINIADAVHYAHQQGMIHRDIKPANIMLDQRGQAILMDFGIVKIIGGDSSTTTGAVVGTASYMPPEVIRGEMADHRSDIYSLGATLFAVISGRPPYVSDSAMTLMNMHLNTPVPNLRDFRPGVDPRLVSILEKCLAKKREDRYQSAAELSSDLHHILNAPSKIEPPGTIKAFPSRDDSMSTVIQGETIATMTESTHKETTQTKLKESTTTQNPLVKNAVPIGLFAGIAVALLIILGGLGISALLLGRALKETPTQEEVVQPPAEELATEVQIAPTSTAVQVSEPTIVPTTRSFPAIIAYVIGGTTEDKAIYVVDSSGSGRRNLTGDSCDNSEPDWSPDGTSLVYQSNCMGSYDIWRVDSNGNGKDVLFSDSGYDEREPHYSPSGNEVAYVRHDKGESYNTNGDIRIFKFGGNDYSTGVSGRGPVYSPDGNHLAYMSYDGRAWQIFVYDLSIGRNEQITFSDTDCRWPVWSPDGDDIAYNSATGQGTNPTGIWIVSADGGNPVQVTASGNYGRPSWSDTGWIIYNTNDGLWAIQPDGSDSHQLTSDRGWAGTWSR